MPIQGMLLQMQRMEPRTTWQGGGQGVNRPSNPAKVWKGPDSRPGPGLGANAGCNWRKGPGQLPNTGCLHSARPKPRLRRRGTQVAGKQATHAAKSQAKALKLAKLPGEAGDLLPLHFELFLSLHSIHGARL